jgi:hypothetical protein
MLPVNYSLEENSFGMPNKLNPKKVIQVNRMEVSTFCPCLLRKFKSINPKILGRQRRTLERHLQPLFNHVEDVTNSELIPPRSAFLRL